MQKKALLLLIFLMMLWPVQLVLAHPGHGNKGIDGYSVLHFLGEPLHLFSIGVIGFAVYLIVRKVWKSGRERSR